MKSRIWLLWLVLISMTLLQIKCSPPKALEYRDFKNFEVKKLGLTNSSVRMDLVYYNPNNFGLQLKKTDLQIYINDTYAGQTSQEFQITIPKRKEFVLPISVDVDMKHIFKNVLVTTFFKEITVKVTGTIKVGKRNVFINFPVKYEGKQQFSLL